MVTVIDEPGRLGTRPAVAARAGRRRGFAISEAEVAVEQLCFSAPGDHLERVSVLVGELVQTAEMVAVGVGEDDAPQRCPEALDPGADFGRAPGGPVSTRVNPSSSTAGSS